MSSIPEHKCCTKCGETKPLDAFHRSTRSTDGRFTICKACKREIDRVYHEANREQRLVVLRAYAAKNAVRANARAKTWREQNPERYRALMKASVARRREKYAANPEPHREHRRRYGRRHPERVRAMNQQRRARKLAATGFYTADEWMRLCRWFGMKCLCCGKRRRLTVDHVVPFSQGGTNMIENIQPLCIACNCSKRDRHNTDYRDPAQLAAFLESRNAADGLL